MTSAADFIAKWGPGGPAAELNERQGAQPYFIELCALLGVPAPGTAGDYLFEQGALVLGAARGYADVFYRDHFAWENKAPGRDLDAALRQLQQYSLALSNPPLLVVCDRLTIRIHTQFNGHPSETHVVLLQQLADPAKQQLLRRLWLDPESFRPRATSRDITEAAAKSFATLAEQLRRRGPREGDARHTHADQVAHFLTQCLFCFFAEDVGLLPGRMFERLVGNRQLTSERISAGLQSLFHTMRSGGLYGPDDIPWFNGGLFARIDVPRLEIVDITELRNAAQLNWSAIDVSIFGTLFERGLDPAKRSQLGAHYTDPATIARIVEPVIQRPLLQQWELAAQEIQALAAKSRKKGDKAQQGAHARFVRWLEHLRDFRILDPACGSGNFLFLGLKALKDIEYISINAAEQLGLDREQDLVTGPHNMLGIELNEYAAELARVTVWIGELQWRLAHGYPFKTNPVLEPLEHIECRDALLAWLPLPRAGEEPAPGLNGGRGEGEVLPPLPPAGEGGGEGDCATHTNAAPPHPHPLPQGGEGVKTATEAPWPRADAVIGNPPFLGGNKKRRELGGAYFDALEKVFGGRVPGSADLVCYWFEKARGIALDDGLEQAGFVSTQSIRHGANRTVLDALVKSAPIFDAWSDEPWVNDGAAVRVSLICFSSRAHVCHLDGAQVSSISSSLKSIDGTPIAETVQLTQNARACYQGSKKIGSFDVEGPLARLWLTLPNPNGRSSAHVLKPYVNALDITRRSRDVWIVDFGLQSAEQSAALFESPFGYVESRVKPERTKNARAVRAKYWWRHGDGQPAMRAAVAELPRFIVTPEVSKHRVFAWIDRAVLADCKLMVIARADDVTFGVLQSRIHEVWSLTQASMHGVGNDPRYTPTTCFETFPFPAGLTPADTAHQRTEALEGGALIPSGLAEDFKQKMPLAPTQQAQAAIKNIDARAAASAIAQAAQRLDQLRRNWLNPPEWTRAVPEAVPLGMDASPYPDRIEPRPNLSEADAKALQKRTLTNLYNQRPAWLAQAHAQLDAAVAAAYGWQDWRADMPDDEILRRLLALNHERSRTADAP